ncbi:glycosyltransferase family 4 protein [Xanthomonas maliensis]|uniref:glycosyltransferase family 4 protein n=1 Tax=Xanthomonas maliensis TaxID=1321368 RepID=UPI00039E11E1|nr:glycosyltransferase family 4 protein [Xanthomonas maliensis]KAB7769408.1 glycosyl transferase [Xanthomonas maliensis]
MSLHVAQLNLVPAPHDWDAEQVLSQWPSLATIADSVSSAGIRVSVIQVARWQRTLHRAGVDYHFLDPGPRGTRVRARRLGALLQQLGADLVHVHGLEFAGDARRLRRWLPRVRILLQDHANRLPRWWTRPLWRWRLAAADGVAFTTLALARPFQRAGLLQGRTQLFAIPESSSRFSPGDQAQARAQTQIGGSPCVLWIGHLSAGKDPLCVLDAVAMAAARAPELQLWCVFAQAPLRVEVEQRIRDDPRLATRVHLLGKADHAQVQTLLRAADLFVSASHGESCGYAALEALACGTLPVLTDIPAFRALSADGAMGLLWPVGDAAQLAERLLACVRQRPSRAQVRAHFDAHLSLPAVGAQWRAAYHALLAAAPEPVR